MRLPIARIISGVLIGILLAFGGFMLLKKAEEPEPWITALGSSKELLPGLRETGRVRMKVSQEISGESIPGSNGIAPVLGRGMKVSARGDYTEKGSRSQIEISSGDGWATVGLAQGKREFISVAGRWYPSAGDNPLSGIVPGGSPRAVLRLWRALPSRASIIHSEKKDGLGIYELKLSPRAGARLARAWAGKPASSLQSIAGSFEKVEVGFSETDGSMVSFSAQGSLSAGQLARLLGLASTAPLGGLRTVGIVLALQIEDWSPPESPLTPSAYGDRKEGQRALARTMLPVWAGIAG